MQKNLTVLPVVAAAIMRADGRVLMQRRRANAVHGGLWEFPGGKIEPGESPEKALVREIDEELALILDPCNIAPLAFACDQTRGSARPPILLMLFACRIWRGDPVPLDADAIGWFAADALDELAMPLLDRQLSKSVAANLQ